MKMLNIAQGPRNASAIILGCMRMPTLSVQEAADMIRAAAEEGVKRHWPSDSWICCKAGECPCSP